jgi:hypothetical protein
VERSRTAHGSDHEGSIAVVDLIRRQHVGPVRIPSIEEADTDALLTELLGEEVEPGRHRGKMARAAKLVGLAVGSIVLCGSVAAAATLSRSRPPATPPVVAAPTPITGIGALRPDTLEAQLSDHGGAALAPVTSAKPSASVTVAPPVGTAPVAVSTPAPPPPAADPQQLVREFYRLVESQPAAAAQLLSPSLLSTDPTGFINAWQSAAKVEVDSVQANPDGTVQAVVRMLQPDGSWLRVVELLHVTQGSQPLISGAQLLSAQNG